MVYQTFIDFGGTRHKLTVRRHGRKHISWTAHLRNNFGAYAYVGRIQHRNEALPLAKNWLKKLYGI
jgi:hypothetical protein